MPPSISISKQGRFVGFLSSATNLVTPNTTGTQGFMRDTCADAQGNCTPTTILASIGSASTATLGSLEIANNSCNATFVASDAPGLAAIVYLSSCSANDLAGGFTSVSAVEGGNYQPAVNSDGRLVAAEEYFPVFSLDPPVGLLFVNDTCTGAPSSCTPTSTEVDNFPGPAGPLGIGLTSSPSISDDGRFVVFKSQPAVGRGGPPGFGANGIFLSDTCNSSSGPVTGCIPSMTAIVESDLSSINVSQQAISGDGRFVIFDSSATNLVTPATTGNQVFVRDTCNSSNGMVSGCTPRTVLISVDSNGNPLGGFDASISGDGHFAAFTTQTAAGQIAQVLFAATGF